MLRSKRPLRIEDTVTREGATRWLDVVKTPLMSASGSVFGILGISRDVTDQKCAQLRLVEAETRLKLALEGSSRALWDWNLVTGAIYLDAGWARMLGAGHGEAHVTLDQLAALMLDEERPGVDAVLHAVLKGQREDYRVEHRIRMADGRLKWIESHGKVVERDAAGRAVRMSGTNADIDERMHASMLLKRQARELAEKNLDLDRFAAMVSHDLRAPVRRIGGFARLLAEHLGTTTDPETRHLMQRIGRSASAMHDLIEDLLAFSRSGSVKFENTVVPLGDLVGQVIEEHAPDPGTPVIEWRVGALPEVQGDAQLLRIALANVIGNAVKYTSHNVHARIELGVHAVDATQVTIFVRDNGVGFDAGDADKLFEVFQRLHGAEFEGTGLGLATVRRIVERHGGRVWAEGATGVGAVFYLTLPRAEPLPHGSRTPDQALAKAPSAPR